MLGIVGIHHFVHTGNPFTVDSDVRLVCQYLQAFKKRGQEVFDPGKILNLVVMKYAYTEADCSCSQNVTDLPSNKSFAMLFIPIGV